MCNTDGDATHKFGVTGYPLILWVKKAGKCVYVADGAIVGFVRSLAVLSTGRIVICLAPDDIAGFPEKLWALQWLGLHLDCLE